MSSLIDEYKSFLNEGKTERECVRVIEAEAVKNGYKNICDVEKLLPGDKVYVSKFGKAVALFEIGTSRIENGMNILGAHIDSPRLDVKQNPVYEKDFIVYLNTHYYGGIKKSFAMFAQSLFANGNLAQNLLAFLQNSVQ